MATSLGSWLARALDPGPSFDELRASAHAVSAHKTGAALRAELAHSPHLARLPVARRAAVDARLAAPTFDEADAHACLEETRLGCAEIGYPIRPGTVEELWYLEGLFLALAARSA